MVSRGQRGQREDHSRTNMLKEEYFLYTRRPGGQELSRSHIILNASAVSTARVQFLAEACKCFTRNQCLARQGRVMATGIALNR